MLTPNELELLTACVDGELDARQRRACARLLRAKPEARRLLAELKGDSRELQAMPAVPAPPSLHSAIVEAAAALPRPQRRVHPPRPASRPLPLWMGYAAAAAVLLAVGLSSFFLHSDNGPRPGKPALVKKAPEPGVLGKMPRLIDEVAHEGNRVVEEMPPPRVVSGDDPDEPEDPPPPTPTPPERRPGPVLASGQTEPVGRLERVEVALPRVHILHGLDIPEQLKGLRAQLSSAPAFRVELPARDGTRGFERVRLALAAIKANVLIDATAAPRLKAPAVRSDFAVYLEDITADDLADVLRAVGAADRAAAVKKPADRHFEGPLVVKELTRWDRRDLTDLLGLDPLKVRPLSKATPVDIRKPLDETTAGQVDDALSGKGPARPGSAVRPQAHGIVLPLTGPRGKTAELKKYLETRTPARPGTLQVLLVVRNVG